jgi:hypothetical protein
VIKGFLVVPNATSMGNLALDMTGASSLLLESHIGIGVDPIQAMIKRMEHVQPQVLKLISSQPARLWPR